MKVQLSDVGKKFGKNWIFQNINLTLNSGSKSAITGPNGSGKSTMLQIISGIQFPTKGKVEFTSNSGIEINDEVVYNQISIATPYMNLFNQLTLLEQIELHLKFRQVEDEMSTSEILERMELEKHKSEVIQDFSSGMKQRLKLGLAFLTQSTLLLLDEPLSNLDEGGRTWYHRMVKDFVKNKTVLVCSNKHEEEYNFCSEVHTL